MEKRSMRKEIFDQIEMFRIYNDIALKGEIVIYGATYMAEFPFYELSQKYLLKNAIYNRSMKGLTLEEAEAGLWDCVLEMKPEKLFLSLGEHDTENPLAIAIYRRILQKIKEKLPSTAVYVMPVPGDTPGCVRLNSALQCLCKEQSVTFFPVSCQPISGMLSYSRIFKQMTCVFRKGPITFTEAFSYS